MRNLNSFDKNTNDLAEPLFSVSEVIRKNGITREKNPKRFNAISGCCVRILATTPSEVCDVS